MLLKEVYFDSFILLFYFSVIFLHGTVSASFFVVVWFLGGGCALRIKWIEHKIQPITCLWCQDDYYTVPIFFFFWIGYCIPRYTICAAHCWRHSGVILKSVPTWKGHIVPYFSSVKSIGPLVWSMWVTAMQAGRLWRDMLWCHSSGCQRIRIALHRNSAPCGFIPLQSLPGIVYQCTHLDNECDLNHAHFM